MTVTQQPSPDWNVVTLKWAGTYIDGSPAKGWIELTYNSPGPMLDDDPVTPLSIFSKGIRVPISETTVPIWTGEYDPVTGAIVPDTGSYEPRTVGYVAVAVPASNDPDIIGGGGSYQYSEILNSGGGRSGVNFVADKDAPGGVVWINKLYGEDSTPAEPVSAVYWSDFNALDERVVTLEQAGPGGASTWDELDGKPMTFPPTQHSLDLTTDTATRVAMTPAERTKLGGVATGATANASNAQLRDRASHTGEQPQSSITGLTSVLGAKADLVGGVVPAGQLPSFVDDVLEFANLGAFPATGESGKIYTALDSNKTYRWSGSVYVVLSDSVALGETAATAYRGDRGKTAYDHSQTAGNPHGTTAAQVGAAPTTHSHTASQVSDSTTVGRAVLTATDASAARSAIGAGTSNLALGTTGTTAKAGNYQPTAANISDASTVGRSVLTATDAPSARSVLGIAALPYPWSASTATIATTATARVPVAQTLAEARMRVATAPAGSALTVVVQRSTGGGAYSDLVTLTIAADSTTEAVQTVTTSLTAGDLLRLNVTSVGSSTAATGVAVEVYPA